MTPVTILPDRHLAVLLEFDRGVAGYTFGSASLTEVLGRRSDRDGRVSPAAVVD